MRNDLVGQLEALATGGDAPSGVYMPLAKKAAAEIERLRAENAKLREALEPVDLGKLRICVHTLLEGK